MRSKAWNFNRFSSAETWSFCSCVVLYLHVLTKNYGFFRKYKTESWLWICEISKNIFFAEHLWANGSANSSSMIDKTNVLRFSLCGFQLQMRDLLLCLLTGIFKYIGNTEDDAVIEVQQSDLAAEHIHQENIKENRRAGATYQWSLYFFINIREGLWQRTYIQNVGFI